MVPFPDFFFPDAVLGLMGACFRWGDRTREGDKTRECAERIVLEAGSDSTLTTGLAGDFLDRARLLVAPCFSNTSEKGWLRAQCACPSRATPPNCIKVSLVFGSTGKDRYERRRRVAPFLRAL